MLLYNVQYYACIIISLDLGCYFGLPAANPITCSCRDRGLPNILLQLWWSTIFGHCRALIPTLAATKSGLQRLSHMENR